MKEIMTFFVLIISVLCFALTYKPEPLVVEKIVEKPVIVEKIVEKPVIIKEGCATRDSPNLKPKKDVFKSHKINKLKPCR